MQGDRNKRSNTILLLMAALITTPIAAQNFELIRDQIALVLALELINQGTVISGFVVPSIGIERMTDVDKTEMPYVNVCFSGADYTSETRRKQAATNNYYIDIWCNAPSTQANTGDFIARQEMERIAGIIRTILQAPVYNTLGFPPSGITSGYASIENTTVTGIKVNERPNTEDSLSTAMCRIFFTVKCEEGVPLQTGTAFQIGTTTLTIGTTTNGYQIEIDG